MSDIRNKIKNNNSSIESYDISQIKALNQEDDQNFSQFDGDLVKIFNDAKNRTYNILEAFYKNTADLMFSSVKNDNSKIDAVLAKVYIEHILQQHLDALKADEKLYQDIIQKSVLR